MAEPVTSGRVTINCSAIGPINIELWPGLAPKACRNFVQLALEGYYDGCIIHRVVPELLVQTGDPTNSGMGGESIWDEPFEDEISQRLKFNRRGIVAMANLGRPNTNSSQFFMTMERADQLNTKSTIFGTIVGDTLYNLLKCNDLELSATDPERPVYPPTIKSIDVIDNPFDDIEPRITAADRKEQTAARKEARKNNKLDKRRGKGTKNAGLLSFEAEAEAETPMSSAKLLSAHDLLKDSNLSKEVRDDRGFSADLPASFKDMPTASSSKSTNPSKLRPASLEPEKPKKKRKVESPPAELSKSDKIRAEIDSVQASLRALKKRKDSDSEDEAKPKKGLTGASLLSAQRNEYLNSQKATRGSKGSTAEAAIGSKKKGSKREGDAGLVELLNSFKDELRDARKAAEREAKLNPPVVEKEVEKEKAAPVLGYNGEILEEEEEEDDNDMSFMTHKLVFRKDVTLNQATVEYYKVIDPRAEGFTLEDAKGEEERRRRKGQAPTVRAYDPESRDQRGGRGGLTKSREYREKAGVSRDWKGNAPGGSGSGGPRGKGGDYSGPRPSAGGGW